MSPMVQNQPVKQQKPKLEISRQGMIDYYVDRMNDEKTYTDAKLIDIYYPKIGDKDKLPYSIVYRDHAEIAHAIAWAVRKQWKGTWPAGILNSILFRYLTETVGYLGQVALSNALHIPHHTGTTTSGDGGVDFDIPLNTGNIPVSLKTHTDIYHGGQLTPNCNILPFTKNDEICMLRYAEVNKYGHWCKIKNKCRIIFWAQCLDIHKGMSLEEFLKLEQFKISYPGWLLHTEFAEKAMIGLQPGKQDYRKNYYVKMTELHSLKEFENMINEKRIERQVIELGARNIKDHII